METLKTVKIHQVLQKAFLLKKKKNPQYSQRALARDLGTSSVFVTKLLTGQKNIPAARYKKIFKVLEMDMTLQTELMRAAILQALPSTELRTMARVSLAKDPAMETFSRQDHKKFGVLKNWYTIAILNYFGCDQLEKSEKAMAAYFSLSPFQVEESLKELEAAGLVVKNESTWSRVDRQSYFPTVKSLDEVRNFHRQMIKKSYDELAKTTQEDFNKRLITGFTIATNPEKLDLAKSLIADFLGELSEVLNEGVCSEVYQCNIQLIPLKKQIRG